MQGLLFPGTKQTVRNNGRDVHIKQLSVIKAEFDCASKVAAIIDYSQSSIFRKILEIERYYLGGGGGLVLAPSPKSYDPRRPPPRYICIWKSRWPSLTVEDPPGGVLDISLGGEVRPEPSYPDPV